MKGTRDRKRTAARRRKADRRGKARGKSAASSGARFELTRLADYGHESILEEIRRVAALVDRPGLSQTAFRAKARVSIETLHSRFGSWRAALARAGLGHRYLMPRDSAAAKAAATRRMSDAELLERLRAAARETGRDVLRIRDMKERGGPDVGTYACRFGSWSKAVRAAGLRSVRRVGPFSDAQCFENLRAVWRFHGRQPTVEDMGRPPSKIGPDAYFHRFGTWRRTLAAFVAKANAGVEPDAGSAPRAAPKAAPPPQPQRPLPCRRVPLALRHAALARDRFRCTACGLSPAIYPFCTLHVDHIVPLALGGRTELANLRTLCSLCNLGKGARLEPGPAPGDPALPPPEPGLPE